MSLIDAYPTQSEIDECKMRREVKDLFKMNRSESDPIGVFLVTCGSRGEKLLFRYPYDLQPPADQDKPDYSCNRFAMKPSLVVTYKVPRASPCLSTKDGVLTGYSDKMLANILAPARPDFCGQKFEVKINDVIFVGFPTVLSVADNTQLQSDFIFNIAFALRSWVSAEVIATYQDLSKQLAVALCHEEHRTGYMSLQKQILLSIQDEYTANQEDCSLTASTFEKLLEMSSLARCLKHVYEDICNTGTVRVYISSWISVSACLEPKVHGLICQRSSGDHPFLLKPQILQRCIKAICPYHAVLLTEDERILFDSLPLDTSPALVKLLRVSSPLKNLQSLASEADLDLRLIGRLVASLVYWGKAMIIFPLCETNVYMVAPLTNAATNSVLSLRFREQFPGLSLPVVLAEFSLPSPLKDHREALGFHQNPGQEVQVMVWLLRHRLIYQVHTFVHLIPKDLKTEKSHMLYRLKGLHISEEEEEDGASESNESTLDSAYKLSDGHGHLSRQMSISSKQRHNQRGGELFVKFTAGERQSIYACSAAANGEDFLLLDRLSKYFNGSYHLEAIMFYENMRRSQLVALIDKFRDTLLITQHDEADISYWIYM